MKLVLLIALLGGIGALQAEKKAGCENTPCDHQCIDTVDSYYCQCYENWMLQPDGHTCLQLAQKDYDTAYLGCWTDDGEQRDLPFNIWTRPDDCNVPQCMHDCRARGFRFAGLQNGDQCWCGNTYQRLNYDNGTCDTPCTGAPAQNCGGATANSVYKVTRDSRYVGCFYEDFEVPDLPEIQWEASEGRSVDECTLECSRLGYLFAGVFDGGQCACGNSFGIHGLAGEINCMVRCFDGYAAQNCGGNETNAVYRVLTGRDFTALEAQFNDEGRRATLPMSELYVYPHQLGLYARRLQVYASDTVNNIHDDTACTSGDCYGLCGEISVPDGFDKSREDVKVRRMHIRLSELPNYIEYPDDAKRVFVFAQTLYIDQSVDFPWSLYIRARQIIINYEMDPTITFSHEGPEFGVNITEALIKGIPSDLTFQKLSLMCARMLLSSEDDRHNRLAWDIIDDLVRDRAYSTEQQHFLDAVAGYRSQFTSIGRNDLHWAPYYTQDFYVDMLETYHLQISLYQDIYQELLDDAIECNQFLDRSSSLIGIWVDAVVAQSKILRDHAKDNVAISREAYRSFKAEYRESRRELVQAIVNFWRGLKNWVKWLAKKAMKFFLNSTNKMSFGEFPCEGEETQQAINEATNYEIGGIELLHVTMENLAKTMEELEAFDEIVDEMEQTEDYSRYMDNVEAVAGLYVTIPDWELFKRQTDEVFNHEEFRIMDHASELTFAIYDLCNWGEALTRAEVEHANNMRVMEVYDALYKNRMELRDRYEGYYDVIGEDCANKDQMVVAFAEQHYDIMLELNNQLIQYCEAHYYETLSFCPEDARPNFAYSVDELLTAVYRAQLYANSFFRSSSFDIDLEIVDDEEVWDNCTDSKICPVTMFRETRMLYYQLPTDHRRFLDIDLILVEEIQLELPGAFSSNASTDFRLLISSSGPFINRLNNEESVFLTRALTEMKFQYDIATGDIELYANLYERGNGGSMIKHMTPFTTWLIQVDPQWTHIDVSQVEMIIMILKGPYKNYLEEGQL